MPAALIWLLLGLALLLLELLGAEFDGLMAAAIAALAISIVSGLLPLAPPLQVAGFLACTGLLLAVLQRWGLRRERGIPPASSGDHATVISGLPAGGEGRVLWMGQSWAAVNLDDQRPLKQGMAVMVLGREGTRLQVLPPAEPPA